MAVEQGSTVTVLTLVLLQYTSDFYSHLYSHLQWKIRRVLAFSLHELAKVVGTENMCADILPVFEEYCTKDIDDVKIGAMSHLAEFFEVRFGCMVKGR